MRTEADHRLPRNVVPRRYDLELEPDLESFTIRLVGAPAGERPMALNAIELDVDEAWLLDGSGRRVADATIAYEPAFERLALTFANDVELGRHRLSLRFSGELNDRLHGFYRSTYKDGEGETRVIATTQFEATDARRAFPCWDEPDLKAVFGVTLVIPDSMVAVSCGPEIDSIALEGGRRRVQFGDTMPLSTYLLAFIVGDFEATAPVDVDGVALRVLHTPGKGHLSGFALEAGAHALRYFSDYYGIEYPGAKLDMVAIPDFSAGAMENLGAITYRESALLVDPTQATQAELERVAAIIAHEIAHMWFGDLVTMRWWNGTWLKEAFATFMEMKSTEAFRPDWDTWLMFGPTRDAAMEIDGLVSTRSIEFPVHSPQDANAMFDTITYEKGSAVLRMFEQYLGEETFRLGISQYLVKHAYGNTDTEDLWEALENASGEPVRAIAEGWIFQGGFPQVKVESAENGVRLTAESFRYLGNADTHWSVPVRYRSGEVDRRVLVDGPVVIAGEEAVVVNAGGSGFYRTRYSPELLQGVIANLGGLDPAERFALVSDTWAAVLAGDASATDYLDLVVRFGAETQPATWTAVLSGLTELDRIASPDDRGSLQDLVGGLLETIVERLGWQARSSESDMTRRLRGIVLRAMGTLANDRETQQRAAATLDAWFDTPDAVDGDIASAALHITAACGDRTHFERFLRAHQAAVSPQDQVRLLRAASDVPDRETALEMLAMVLDGRIRRQDAYWIVARLIGQRDTGAAVWEVVRSRWSAILDAMPPQNARLMLNQLHHRSEPHVAADIQEWLSANPIRGSEQLVAQQLERLAIRVALRNRERDRLSEALTTS